MRPEIVAVLLSIVLAAGTAAAQAPASGIDAARAALELGDWAAAKAQLDPLVQRRDPRAQTLLADLHYAPGGTGDFLEDSDMACDLYERAAAANHGDAIFGLGRCFVEGRGRPQEPSEARALFDRAAQRGSARAWCALGRMSFEGVGGRVDPTVGVAMCRQGSAVGDADADLELGMRYLEGRGVPQSFTDAKPWLERAARQGKLRASRALADAYARGRGVPRDSTIAARYLDQAARAGDMDAALQIVNQRLAAGMNLSTDRRVVIETMFWLGMIARSHHDAKRREVAGYESEDLRRRFPDYTAEADFMLEKAPRRPGLAR